MPYKVTIGIPVYNAEKYISRSLESALAQTFHSVELLVCDDGSTDSTMDIVKKMQVSHPRGCDIRIVYQSRHSGVGNARNRIIDEARGEYLFFLDADDEISIDAIGVLYGSAEKYDADIVYGSHERIEEFGNCITRNVCCYPAKIFCGEDEFALWAYRKYDGIQATTWNFLIKLDIYRMNGLCYQPVNFWEDFSLTIDLPTYVTRVILLPNVTYYYYCREGTLSNYKKRDYIEKKEIQNTIDAVNNLKSKSERIKGKPYLPLRMYKLMMTDFYMIGTIIKNMKIIHPSFSKRELCEVMKYPLPFMEIMKFRKLRIKNLLFYILGLLPSVFSISLVKFTLQHRKLIKDFRCVLI